MGRARGGAHQEGVQVRVGEVRRARRRADLDSGLGGVGVVARVEDDVDEGLRDVVDGAQCLPPPAAPPHTQPAQSRTAAAARESLNRRKHWGSRAAATCS